MDKLQRSPLVNSTFMVSVLSAFALSLFVCRDRVTWHRSLSRWQLPTTPKFSLPAHANTPPHQADYFPDYTGGDNFDAVCDYFLHRFVSLNQSAATKQIYAHYISTMDSQHVKCECFYPCGRQSPRAPHAMTSVIFHMHPRE
jgi:hypothetical protein